MTRPKYARLVQLAFLAAVAAAAAPAGAATRVWPVLIGAGCNGTLQQCINGAAAGDTVRIINDDFLTSDGYTAVDEDIVISKSLTLEAAPGVDAVFLPGRTVLVFSPTSGAVAVNLRRLVVRAGSVRVVHRNVDPGSYALDQIRIEEADGGIGECAVGFEDRGEGMASFVLGDSTMRFSDRRAFTPSAICAFGQGGAWQVSIFRNFIESAEGSLFAGVTVTGSSAGHVTVSGNQLHIDGASRGIVVAQSPGSSANVASINDNLVTGQRSVPPAFEYALAVNPMNTDMRIVNNTLARNSNGIGIGFFEGNASAGRIANNVVAYNAIGLNVDARFSTISRDQNIVFGNEVDTGTPSAGTIASDPMFVAHNDFRLRMASPARDNGNNADVATFLGVAFDADGERRFSNGIVDIGAFEWSGDQSLRHLATATNTLGNNTRFEGFQFLGPFENLIVTPLRAPAAGSELQETLGVFQAFDGSGDYFAFHEDIGVDLSPGRSFHALAPLGGVTGFLHTSTLASVVDAYSRISHPELDSKPGAIAFVVHNWNPGGGPGVYHDHRLGLDYAAPNWFVGNQDDAAMASGRSFNIVVAPVGSPNAFVREVGASPRAELRLEHALLDDNACATLQVGRSGSTLNDTAFSIEYRPGGAGAPGHWFIVAEGAGTPAFPANTAFNVMVSGAQANACRTSGLFADGFE